MRLKQGLRGAFLVLLLGIAGCAPAGPPFASVAGTLPPVPAGAARVFLYRWLEPYESLTPTTAFLNGGPIGVTETGAVLYRDVAPGRYTIAVQSEGIFPNQFKTVTLKAGDTVYVRIDSLRNWAPCGSGGGGESGGGASSGCADTFVVQIMDPAVASYEMRDLRLIRG
jgi:hypothetical protein